MTTPGIDVADFQTMFPEFSSVSSSIITIYVNLINNGYGLVANNVTDSTVLNIYYFLCAHLVQVATNYANGTTSGPSPWYALDATSTSKASFDFVKLQEVTIDQSFMTSTRYGQVYWTFMKQQYIQNYYLNQPVCWSWL